MRAVTWILAAACAVLLATAVLLYRQNRALERRLAENAESAARVSSETAGSGERAGGQSVEPDEKRRGRSGWFGRLRGASDRVQGEQGEREETRAERRLRREQEIRAMLGRDGGETEEEYRARMIPLIVGGLAGPRKEVEATRRELEERARVTDDQRAQLDEILTDVRAEALDLTNRAIESGDLTPYRRNWSGILSFGGGMGAILDSAETRIGGVLTPDQLDIFSGGGFEWGEYLGVTVPWESLKPPPLPPDSGSGG